MWVSVARETVLREEQRKGQESIPRRIRCGGEVEEDAAGAAIGRVEHVIDASSRV
jgi:hypothetical protein